MIRQLSAIITKVKKSPVLTALVIAAILLALCYIFIMEPPVKIDFIYNQF